MKSLILLHIIFFEFFSAIPNFQELTTIRGRVSREDGRLLKNLVVRIAGYGEARTTDSGEFVIQLPGHIKAGDPIQFVIKDQKLKIKIPWDGKLNVPADTKTLVEIVVAPVHTAKKPSLQETISETFAALTNRLVKTEEDKQKAMKQEELLKGIATLFPQFISRAKDLRDSFDGILQYLPLQQSSQKNEALEELADRVEAYNEAYNELNNNKFYFVQNANQYWHTAELTEKVNETFNYALEEIHNNCILKFNEVKTLVNILNAKDKTGKNSIKEIENRTHKIIADFDIKILELEEKVTDFFVSARLETTK